MTNDEVGGHILKSLSNQGSHVYFRSLVLVKGPKPGTAIRVLAKSGSGGGARAHLTQDECHNR